MRRTKEDTERTRQLIIKKAVELFLKKGFNATKLEEIARKANVTRGAIHWHFEDKLDILKELVEDQHRDLTQQLHHLFAINLPPFLKIERVVQGVVDYFYDSQLFRSFIELTWFKIEYTNLDRLYTTKAQLNSYFLENMDLLVREARKVGEIKPGLSEGSVAMTLVHMVNGMYRMYFVLPDRFKSKDVSLRLFRDYLRLIRS